MRYATYEEFINNIGLFVGIEQQPAHWYYDEEDKEFKFEIDDHYGLLHPPHCKTLKELFERHAIWYDESNGLV